MSIALRTEDIDPQQIIRFFIETKKDRQIIQNLKSSNPILLEGSRGTGKSFLMRVAEKELSDDFNINKVLPVYLTFSASSLVQTSDDRQFLHWMLAKLSSRILRSLRKHGVAGRPDYAVDVLNGGRTGGSVSKMEELVAFYEDSWRGVDSKIDTAIIPSVEDLKDSIEDICEEHGISRICVLFDEAAHVFRPEQQRDFFNMFRDLRSSKVSCNAAVYPGVTSYGNSFQLAHDATLIRIERDILDGNYLDYMEELVVRQVDDERLVSSIKAAKKNFRALAFAAHGNPRILLKTISSASRMQRAQVDEVFRQFYRSTVWSEYTQIGEVYSGYSDLVDWGRDFIEKAVLLETKRKNDNRIDQTREESTCFFWIHRDAPLDVRKALGLLAYSGLVQKIDDGIRGTRSELGSRYAVQFGCLLALEANPVEACDVLAKNLSIKRFTEFGARRPEFEEVVNLVPIVEKEEIVDALKKQLNKSIDVLDISDAIKKRLEDAEYLTIRDVLNATESEIEQRVYYVGPQRAREIYNSAKTVIMEYLM